MRRQLDGIKAESRLGDQLVFDISPPEAESQNKRNLSRISEKISPREN